MYYLLFIVMKWWLGNMQKLQKAEKNRKFIYIYVIYYLNDEHNSI